MHILLAICRLFNILFHQFFNAPYMVDEKFENTR